MGAIIAAGSLLIAYSPVAVLLLAYAARRSALLVLTIARCVRAHWGVVAWWGVTAVIDALATLRTR